MPDVKGRSTIREEQAAATRRRILDAAVGVFTDQGFAGTRIEDVAAEAGVAVATVYKTFTNKANLLAGALDQAMTGGDPDHPIDEQPWWREQLDEPDAAAQLRLVARNARDIYERAAALLAVLASVAPSGGALAGIAAGIEDARLARSRRTSRSLHAKASDRMRLPRDETARTLLVLTVPDLFTAYTSTGGTADRYEAWLGDVLCRALLL
jgi:AcrR family transcriptional regulator